MSDLKNTLNMFEDKTISSVYFDKLKNVLCIQFVKGGGLNIFDFGEEYCVLRHMSTSDTLSDFKGDKLLDISVKAIPNEHEKGAHDKQLLEVATDNGVFQMISHTERGGEFNITCQVFFPSPIHRIDITVETDRGEK